MGGGDVEGRSWRETRTWAEQGNGSWKSEPGSCQSLDVWKLASGLDSGQGRLVWKGLDPDLFFETLSLNPLYKLASQMIGNTRPRGISYG